MKYRSCLVVALVLASLAGRARGAEQQWNVVSPDGQVSATLALQAVPGQAAYPADKVRLYYRVELGAAGSRAEVLPWSPLGIVRSDADFVDGLSYKGCDAPRTIDETYRIPHGKRSEYRSLAREQTFRFANPQGAEVELVFRAANDGVAFRYRFPGHGDKRLTVTRELTGFHLPAEGRAWMTPYSVSSQWTPAYEEYYLNDIPVGTLSPKAPGWAFPALFRVRPGGPWVLLTEAAADGSYCGCRLDNVAAHGVYRLRFPDPEEGWGQGAVTPSAKLPWATPWRVVLVAARLAGIVESSLVTDLNPPCQVKDTSWIRPGRVAWSWWSDHDSPRDYRKQCAFVDLAAEMGWEYMLVDANWDLMDGGNVRELAQYAKRKGVGVLLWYNSGGDHNIVTERPRGLMNVPQIRKFEFELLRKWGVAGVKIDFFQSDKQNILGLYHDILRDAAEAKILINFHGCTVPRGWERTWPHLMSMEAVRGAECYTFAQEFPAEAPAHNAVLPFTRNAVGPMDYTPCALTDDKFPHQTTNAHELALPIVFESGWLHFADRVSAYRELAAAPKALLRAVPAAWDETRFVDGEPGKFVVLARRKGDAWYLAAINGQRQPLRVSAPLRFLGAGSYEGMLIGDGAGPRALGTRPVTVKSGDALDLSLLPCGGAAVQLKPQAGR